MPELIRGVWPEGWRPSQNDFNGSVNGLLRSDNLRPDDVGVLSLVPGTTKLSSGAFTGNGNFIFSSVMDLENLINATYPGNAKVRYVGQANGTLLRNFDPTNKTIVDYGLSIFSTGSGVYAGANCFGHNLLFSGTQKWKDRGDEQWPLGIDAPAAVGVASNVPPFVYADNRNGSGYFNNWDTAAVEGTAYTKNGIDYVTVTAAAVSGSSLYRSIVQRGILTTTNIDLNTLSSGVGTNEDLFRFSLRLSNTDSFIKIRVEYLLETPTVNSPAPVVQDISNYYWHEWTNRVSEVISPDLEAPDLIPFEATQAEIDALRNGTTGVSFVPSIRSGINVWSTLQCKRGDFTRVGDNDALDWSTVKGIRVLVFATDAQVTLVNLFQFIGGTQGTLTGNFSYIQVDCRDTNTYIETSLPGIASSDVTTFGSSNLISPTAPDSQANFIRIYRASDQTDGYYLIKAFDKVFPAGISNAAAAVFTQNGHGLSTGNVIAVRGGLVGWAGINGNHSITVTSANTFTVPINSTGFGTLTGSITYSDYSPFNDYFSDTEALLGGYDARFDFGVEAIPDNIIAVVAPYFTRAIYADYQTVYVSVQNNPGLIESGFKIEVASDNNEIILFMRKVAEKVIYIATTKDIYILAGDGTIDGTGAINFQLAPLGIEQLAISNACAVEDSTLYYLAADGWRYISGSTSQLVSRELDLLFQGETRYGLTPFVLPARNQNTNCVVVTKGKLYCSMEQTTLGRCLVIYDLARKTWRYQRQATAANNPFFLYLEEDGTILYTTESTGDRFLHGLDSGTLIDGVTKWDMKLLTVYDADSKPKNRKDLYTLKVDMNSGGDNVTITLRALTDDSTPVSFAVTTSFTGRTQKTFAIYSTLGIRKWMQLEIYSSAVSVCTIYNYSIDYELRPTQLTDLRIPPSNLGVQGRKRIPEIPMVIDTLGNAVTFTPLLDGVSETPGTITTSNKTTYNYQFATDKRAIDIGGLLSCATGVFEFYELVSPREVEVLPDSLKFKRVAATNLGTSARKRIAQFAFVIDTKGNNVTYVPIIDGVSFPSAIYNTARKQTVIYAFTTQTIGIDLEGTLSAVTGDFEYYGPDYGDSVYEKLPPIAKFLHLTSTNLGTSSRKRIAQFAFVIDTKGNSVTFTPRVDGVSFPVVTYNTTRKQTVIYTFITEAIGIDIEGTLTASAGDFEYYGPDYSDCVYEKLPALASFMRMNTTNWNSAAKKRIRTIPLVIDTKGNSVVFTPSVDGVAYPATTFNTSEKRTVLYYFESDAFGIDVGGTLSGTGFEFYGMLTPEVVEVLPVAKRFDQLGPIEFKKLGKLFSFRLRLIPTGTAIAYNVYMQDVVVTSGTIVVTPNVQAVYEVKFPKFIMGQICRIELQSSAEFHRLSGEYQVAISGAQTDMKWVKMQ